MRPGRFTTSLVAITSAACIVGASPAVASGDSARTTEVLVWSQYAKVESNTVRLVIARADGSGVRALTHPDDGVQDIDARISPNGRWVLFERDLPDRAVAGIVAIDGRGERLLELHCTAPCAGTNVPTWMPDGQHILYDRVSGPFDADGNATEAALYTSDLVGGAQTRFSDAALDPTTEETNASFTPDGHVIVSHGLRDRRTAIFRLDADGTHPRQLTPFEINADLPQASPARSGPGAGLVVFETFGSGVPEDATEGPSVATVPANCPTLARCAAAIRYVTSRSALPVQNFNPAWEPGARSILFVHAQFDLSAPVGDIYRADLRTGKQSPVSQDPRFELRPAAALVSFSGH